MRRLFTSTGRCSAKLLTLGKAARARWALTWGAGFLLFAAVTRAQVNLVEDASFEAPVASVFRAEGFSERPARARETCYVSKEMVEDAREGRFVLCIRGWDSSGSLVLSEPIPVDGVAFSGTLDVRGAGIGEGVQVEYALFDGEGCQKLASFGVIAPGTRWQTIQRSVKLSAGTASVRLGILISGPQRHARVELDCAGLFPGEVVGKVRENAEFVWWEAEEMADGKAWFRFGEVSYLSPPSGGGTLSGAETATVTPREVRRRVPVRHPGRHRIWLRYLQGNFDGKFSVRVCQGGHEVARREFGSLHPQRKLEWVWDSVDAPLGSGEAEIALQAPSEASTTCTRLVDLMVMTNLASYEPQPNDLRDFRPRGFLRFVNTSPNQDPFCWFFYIVRSYPPDLAAGMLGSGGFYHGFNMPGSADKWLGAEDRSPWIGISDELLAGNNNLRIVATRKSHVHGFVEGPIQGAFEFAVGPEHRVIRRIPVDQVAPQVRLMLPCDFRQEDGIKGAEDFLAEAKKNLPAAEQGQTQRARRLDLSAIVSLDENDDPRVVDEEIKILRSLGFNNTYAPVVRPTDARSFAERHGLLTNTFGASVVLDHLAKDGCQNQPDEEGARKALTRGAEKYRPILDGFRRLKLADEPAAMDYAHFAQCVRCQALFREGLQKQGVTPSDLGVASWEEVRPVTHEDRAKHPALFYQTGRFRLETFARFMRSFVRIKGECFPSHAAAYVNYAPPGSEFESWVWRGTDLFLCQRDNLEMAWTEDWLGYAGSVQHMSDTLAMVRAAAGRQPLGGYMVAVGANAHPTLLRLKYYQWFANAVRFINVYMYGPFYAIALDSWSRRYELFPILRELNREAAQVESVMENATRWKTEVGILYNRTASIWEDRSPTTEPDARYVHWALTHAGYNPDFISEEDLVGGGLNRFKVLYVGGAQILPEVAKAIAAWVQRGGVLCGTAGAGSRDQFNRPLKTLERVFGAQSEGLKVEARVGTGKYELPALKALSVLSSVEDAKMSPVAFDQLCVRETLSPAPEANVLLRNKEGRPTGTFHRYGQGAAIRLAALPGIAYLHGAKREQKSDPVTTESYLVRAFRKDLRNFICWPAAEARAARVATWEAPAMEVVRYDKPQEVVLFLLNYSGVSEPEFAFRLPDGAKFTSARSLRGARVILEPMADGAANIRVALDTADTLVLSSRP